MSNSQEIKETVTTCEKTVSISELAKDVISLMNQKTNEEKSQLLQSHIYEMYNKSVDAVKVANELEARNIFHRRHVEDIESMESDLDSLQEIYRVIKEKNLWEEFILVLDETENTEIMKSIQQLLS